VRESGLRRTRLSSPHDRIPDLVDDSAGGDKEKSKQLAKKK